MSILLAIFLVVGLLVCTYIYIAVFTSICIRKYNENKKAFEKQLSEVEEIQSLLKNDIVWKWPIWPRPILYNNIDRRTQMVFAQAEQAIQDIDSLKKKFRPGMTQSTGIQSILNIKANISQLVTFMCSRPLFKNMGVYVKTIKRIPEEIQKNQTDLESLQNRVVDGVHEFQKILSENINQNELERIGDKKHQVEVKLILEAAKSCSQKASLSISNVQSIDGIEYAIGNFWCKAGYAYWSLFTKGLAAYTYPLNFELDSTSLRLKAAYSDLDSLIQQPSPGNWKTLLDFYQRLALIEVQIKRIEASIVEFDKGFRSFQQKIAILPSLGINDVYYRACNSEKSLSEFIGNQVENPEEWKRILGNPTLPSLRFQAKKTFYVDQVQSLFESVIKESNIKSINKEIDKLLFEVREIEKAIILISEETHRYQEAEGKVKQSLSTNGAVTIGLNALTTFANDSTPEIKEKVAALYMQFKQFTERAWGDRRRAKYIEFVKHLKEFEANCSSLVRDHEKIIEAYQKSVKKQFNNVRSLQKSIIELAQRLPSINHNYELLFKQFTDNEERYRSINVNSYESLMSYINCSEELLSNASKEKMEIEKIYKDFEFVFDKTCEHIKNIRRTLESVINEISKEWSIPLKKEIIELEVMIGDIDAYIKRLELVKKLPTVEIAMKECKKIDIDMKYVEENAEPRVLNVKETLRKINEKKKLLQDQLNYPDKYEISSLDIIDVRPACNRLVRRAATAAEPTESIWYLERALEIIKQPKLIKKTWEYIYGDKNVTNIGSISDINNSKINISGRDITQTKYDGF